MKKIGLILAGCLAFVGLYNAHADDFGDAVRAASRRDANTPLVLSRQRTDSVTADTTSRKSSNTVVRNAPNSTRSATVVNRSSEQPVATPTNVVARTAVTPRATTAPQKTRSVKSSQTRSATRATTARNATRATVKVATREEILKRDYSKCKEVFNDCMDEFCANKDSQLKRCACSARVHDFDRIKKQLAEIDEKMLDFDQRLLTVSMDEKDVAAINVETEGEKAFYNTKDVSESKRTLDAIAKKLNTSFDSSNFSPTLGSALSWSLDIDSAFDSVDSLRGVSTAAKSGTALYSAALPICREMAAEVCSEEDIDLAESGYQILITQSCDTVEKTYKTAVQQARSKVLESSALLDISRLNVYQNNNADDILTCKKKMLAMLSDSTVCGDNLGKCLDITGQYIDPSTGEAFLSADLAELGNLITRPDETQTWTTAPGNSVFVSFLQSKKKFLEPAMENCQDIADTVWNTFIEDALSQIKIAQIRKLEDVRQSCTTLTAQCLTDANESITDFDARALSTFGVAADMTVNAMCENVLSSCTTLLNTTDTDMGWYFGMTGIQTDITYETIKQTCREVGRACIIQVCTSTSGNFGLCENIDTSVNRKSIINRTACWDEVLSCVASAGEDAISAIFTQNGLDQTDESNEYPYTFYSKLYGINEPTIAFDTDSNRQCVMENDDESCLYDICYNYCAGAAYTDSNDCRVCRIAENIWGNCEADPTTQLPQSGMHNKIKKPQTDSYGNINQDTLLYWFARNTNTENVADSCRDTTCGVGFVAVPDPATNTVMCIDKANLDDFGEYCNENQKIKITDSTEQCCTTGTDASGNCCQRNSRENSGICVPNNNNSRIVATFRISAGDNTYYPSGNYQMYCTGGISTNNNNQVVCSGDYVIIKTDGQKRYMGPLYGTTPSSKHYETFNIPGDNTYNYIYENGDWKWSPDGTTPSHWNISF